MWAPATSTRTESGGESWPRGRFPNAAAKASRSSVGTRVTTTFCVVSRPSAPRMRPAASTLKRVGASPSNATPIESRTGNVTVRSNVLVPPKPSAATFTGDPPSIRARSPVAHDHVVHQSVGGACVTLHADRVFAERDDERSAVGCLQGDGEQVHQEMHGDLRVVISLESI